MGAQLKFGISQKFFVLGLSPATGYAHRRFPSLLTKGLIITSLLHATEVYVKYIITVHDMMIAEMGCEPALAGVRGVGFGQNSYSLLLLIILT